MKQELEFTVQHMNWGDLKDVSVEHMSFYACLCFIVNELNVLQRLTLISLKLYEEGSLEEAAAKIQRNTLTRLYSSKCFEAQKFIEKCAMKARDGKVKDLARHHRTQFADLNDGKGFEIARHIRDKVGFHLDFREVQKSVSRADAIVDCDSYLHTDGNCFFPLGECVVQEWGYWGASEDAKHSVLSDSDLDDWVNWSVSVHSLTKDIHFEAFEKFVWESIEHVERNQSQLTANARFIAQFGQTDLPLFLEVPT